MINADMKRPSLKCIHNVYRTNENKTIRKPKHLTSLYCIWINWLWCNLQYVSKMNIYFPIRIMLYCNCLCLFTFKNHFLFGGGLWWVNAFCGKLFFFRYLLEFSSAMTVFFYCRKIAFQGWTIDPCEIGKTNYKIFLCWLHTFRR